MEIKLTKKEKVVDIADFTGLSKAQISKLSKAKKKKTISF